MDLKVQNELKDAVSQIQSIMEQSERTTKLTVDSIKNIETNITNAKLKMDTFFSVMNPRQLKFTNLEKSIRSLDDLYRFLQTLDDDEAYIQHGPQGSLEEYIKRLENLKSFLKYNQTNNYLFKTRMRKLNVLLVEGERILSDEFKNVIKHYSSQETITSFISYLINIVDFNSLNISDNEQQSSQNQFLLFIPKETLQKLQIVCTWFLDKEQNSDLYNEKHEHIDIIDKLSYVDIRFEFIKLIIKYYLKLNNCDSPSTQSSVFSSASSSSTHQFNQNSLQVPQTQANSLAKLNKLLHLNHTGENVNSIPQQQTLLPTPRSPLNGRYHHHQHNESDSHSNQLQFQQQQQNDNLLRKISTANLTSLMIEESNKLLVKKTAAIAQQQPNQKSRSLDCIQLFNDNLNFCLKILQHEKLIVNYIFKNSDVTCNELLSKLTVLIIDEIQNELSVFLTQNIDFKKSSNNGPHVVKSIIDLVVKVNMLKRNTNGMQLDNMESASRLFQFSASLNSITAQIFFSYLDTIKNGHFNCYQFPSDCSIHDYCESTCDIIRRIKANEGVLDSAIKLLCENFIDGEDGGTHAANSTAPDEPVKGRYRLRSQSTYEAKRENDRKLDYAKYFWLIIKRLNNFLIEEAIKSSTTSTTAITNISATKNGIINLKAYVFLLNNLNFILECAAELNLIELFRIINQNFDSFINESIQKNCEKACDIFQDINLKWKTVVKQTEANTAMLDSLNSATDAPMMTKAEKRLSTSSEKRHSMNADQYAQQLSSAFQTELNEQQQFVNNLNKIQSASSVAKRAFKTFKSAVLKPKSVSDENDLFEDGGESGAGGSFDQDDLNELNLVRVTRLASISSASGHAAPHAPNDVTLLTITRNISELKKRRLALVQQLTTAIELSTKVVIINPTLNSRIKEMVRENLNPMLDSLEQTGEIRGIIRKIFVHNNFSNKSTSLKDQIYDEMFPNYKL